MNYKNIPIRLYLHALLLKRGLFWIIPSFLGGGGVSPHLLDRTQIVAIAELIAIETKDGCFIELIDLQLP